MDSNKTTIKDIAAACGVSLMTVSRALQGKPGVGLEKKRKIEKVAETLGYVPHRMAYALGQKNSSMTAGVVIPQLSNTIFPTILQNIESSLSPNGYRILLCCTYDNPIKEFHEISALLERQVDGIIWSPVLEEDSEKAARLILEQNCPLVFLDRMLPSIAADAVLVDDFTGAYDATRHLLDQGMRRIVHLAPRTESYVARERRRGYLAALADGGVEFHDEWILKIGSELQHGREGMNLLLNSGLSPDAIFCFNDPLAIGACMTLTERGIAVPEKIAVVGFSATIETEFAQIPLTSVFQDAIGLGRHAAEMLLSRMINPELKISPRKKILKTNLIVRQSSIKIQGRSC